MNVDVAVAVVNFVNVDVAVVVANVAVVVYRNFGIEEIWNRGKFGIEANVHYLRRSIPILSQNIFVLFLFA